MKTKSICASDGSVTLANSFFRSGIVSIWDLLWDIFKLYLVRNCFYLVTHFLFSLWHDVYYSLQTRNTVWMGDSISRSSKFIGFLGKRTALEKSWYKTNYGSETVIPLYITGCREKIYCTNQPASLRDYGWFEIYFLPTAGDRKRYHRLRTVISLQSFLYDDIIGSNIMFWVFVEKNLTSCTAKMVWKALLFITASQIQMTFSILLAVAVLNACNCIFNSVFCYIGAFPMYWYKVGFFEM